MLSRIARDTVVTCGLFVLIAIVIRPSDWRLALGVLGGCGLLAISVWAIRGTVDAWIGRAMAGNSAAGEGVRGGGPGLVKFFTRYAMLAFAAYVMMARLHLDPLGLLAGVTALGVAAGAEALRGIARPNASRRG